MARPRGQLMDSAFMSGMASFMSGMAFECPCGARLEVAARQNSIGRRHRVVTLAAVVVVRRLATRKCQSIGS